MSHSIESPYVLFMKVGCHAREGIDEIYRRKALEEAENGVFYWGYGGTLCHPSQQVHRLARLALANNELPLVAMIPTESKFVGSNSIASELSVDRHSWLEIPPEVAIYGSRYALVCTDLRRVDIEIDLSQYMIAVGPSRGTLLSRYMCYRVDKACALKTDDESRREKMASVGYTARLVSPFAVFLR